MFVWTVEDIDRYLGRIRMATPHTHTWIATQTGDPLDLLRRMKVDQCGFHPIEGHALNFVEQVNQTWTYIVARAAARHSLEPHPRAGAYRLAPGACASMPLDIMSEVKGLVGAGTFASVDPHNNRKLDEDLKKMAARPEEHRYIFFASSLFPNTRRLAQFERDGIQVWCVDV